ncbi:MAG TPA: hypothetical protein H9948_04835 [Candidatus Jeotgalibaca merdavium]|uniref:Uncharacterized protein n=1 Tax=Candidatus Jeotgalibaca merdavium TaxID=2838627 RepID=A0A9D2I1H4_9LACT|nr:hypothetical protein [Candidatus Jeotgalibaca merdavium]
MKLIKRITVILMAMIIMATGVAFASGYITWNGSNNYNQTIINLDAINTRGQELKSERDLANASNEQLQNIIRDKENVIRDKDNQIIAKQNEIDQLKNQQGSNNDQLKQAEIDMQSVKDKSQQVLDDLR